MTQICVTSRVSFEDGSIDYRFTRAGGPGGQNVNKVETAVELRFDLAGDRLLPEDVKVRLRQLAGRRLSGQDILIIQAQRFRSQGLNREDAFARLLALIERAAAVPEARLPSMPSGSARRRRMEVKKLRSATKATRGAVRADDG
ncbi:MAG: alternative ribosome rescue aminoacyl-tRNA hydrolase ArfB [Betaproteobacteria bacterium]